MRHAIFVHVARRDEAVIGGDRRPQRHLVIGMADLRQRLDRGVAALPGQAVLAADHQHMLYNAGIDQMMRQHGHREPGGAADLHRVGIGRPDAEMLGEHGREHDVRRHGRVAAKDAVDVGSLQPGVGNGKLGRLAHEVERGRAFVLAVGRQPNAGDEAHVRFPTRHSGAARSDEPGIHTSREYDLRRSVRNDSEFAHLNTTSAGPAPSRR